MRITFSGQSGWDKAAPGNAKASATTAIARNVGFMPALPDVLRSRTLCPLGAGQATD
jgi:hypothetical protein